MPLPVLDPKTDYYLFLSSSSLSILLLSFDVFFSPRFSVLPPRMVFFYSFILPLQTAITAAYVGFCGPDASLEDYWISLELYIWFVG